MLLHGAYGPVWYNLAFTEHTGKVNSKYHRKFIGKETLLKANVYFLWSSTSKLNMSEILEFRVMQFSQSRIWIPSHIFIYPFHSSHFLSMNTSSSKAPSIIRYESLLLLILNQFLLLLSLSTSSTLRSGRDTTLSCRPLAQHPLQSHRISPNAIRAGLTSSAPLPPSPTSSANITHSQLLPPRFLLVKRPGQFIHCAE